MEERPACVLSGTWTCFSDDSFSDVFTSQLPNDSKQLKGFLESGVNPFVHGSAMFRADAYRALPVGYRFSNPIQDFDLWLRLSKLGEVGILERVEYFYRMHRQSISSTTFASRAELVNIALELHNQRETQGLEQPETLERMGSAFDRVRMNKAPKEDFASYSTAIECLRVGQYSKYRRLMGKVASDAGMLARKARWHVRVGHVPFLLRFWYWYRLRNSPGYYFKKRLLGTSPPADIRELWNLTAEVTESAASHS